MSFRLIPLLASGAFLLSSGAAIAQTATANANVNVRSGPGARYEVIDRLPAGEPVNIINCRGDWCEISMGGDSGFVARSYLDDNSPQRSRVRIMEDDDYGSERIVVESYDPGAIAGLSIGGYYESRPYYIREGYYYWGGRWYGRRPGVSGWRNGSWRRWEERRGPREGRFNTNNNNRPQRVEERRARIDNNDRDPRIRPMEPRGNDGDGRGGGEDRFRGRDGGGRNNDGGSRANVDRGGGGRETREPRASEPGRGGGDIGARPERPEFRNAGPGTSGGGRGPDGGGRTPGGSSNDRGDRVGLDRAGSGGGRNDR